jgi:hypothetical protein
MSTITEIELIKAYVRDAFAGDTGAKEPKPDSGAAPELDIDSEAIEVPMHKHRKLRKVDLEKFKDRLQEGGSDTANLQSREVPPAMKDQIQGVYKVWSAFTKTLRAIVVKYFDDDLVIKTVYFGKFYVPKLDKAQAN